MNMSSPDGDHGNPLNKEQTVQKQKRQEKTRDRFNVDDPQAALQGNKLGNKHQGI